MFILQESPIDAIKAKDTYSSSHCGALLVFEGMVRADQLKDSEVKVLQYLADSPACTEEGQRIVMEVKEKFSVENILCIQRIGELTVGETAIWIGVWAAHRDEAYKASRYIIEEVKKRLRIWKKEHLINGSSVWQHGIESSK